MLTIYCLLKSSCLTIATGDNIIMVVFLDPSHQTSLLWKAACVLVTEYCHWKVSATISFVVSLVKRPKVSAKNVSLPQPGTSVTLPIPPHQKWKFGSFKSSWNFGERLHFRLPSVHHPPNVTILPPPPNNQKWRFGSFKSKVWRNVTLQNSKCQRISAEQKTTIKININW